MDFELAGGDYQGLRQGTRAYLLAAAASYGQEYLPSTGHVPKRDALIVMTGHQPEYFHPGVWFKNFLASELARHASATAIHLIVDNDLCRAQQIRVPTKVDNHVQLRSVPLDADLPSMPFEERRIVDADVWQFFAERVSSVVEPLVRQPLINGIWPAANSAARRHGNLGRAICESRHLLEHRWGLRTWEIPFSSLAETEGHLHFVAHLLHHLPRFHSVFHRALRAHRREYRIRSQTHPVPNLQRDGDWWESPFWIWTAGDPRRQPLWVRRSREWFELRGSGEAGVLLADRGERVVRLDRAGHLVPGLLDLTSRGIKIRPRALTLTMFARMFLCDLFIHGIGGAQYDRLTDQLIDSFFHVTPSEFVTATATRHLPIPHALAEPDDIRRIDGELRDLWYHPERYFGRPLAHTPETQALALQKHSLVSLSPPRGNRKAWHEEISQINARLRESLQPTYDRLQSLRRQAVSRQRELAILTSREHPFCLFPEEDLCGWLLDMAQRLT
jgi:hypothetical protein